MNKKILNNKLKFSILIFIVFVIGSSITSAENLEPKYDLREHINIEVRDQMNTNTCWAFAASSMLSTHLALVHNEEYTFSPRHFEYIMSEDSILNYENRYAYEGKTLDLGGMEDVVKQYFIQGTGPILEQNMPFENNYNPISNDLLPLDLEYKQVVEATHILPVYKEWNGNTLIYKDHNKNVINTESFLEYQNSLKSAIKKYGGVQASLSVDKNSFNKTNGAYNQKIETGFWHAILLIGWDDNYSKDNFKEEVKPLNNGAYIALNSWGDYVGDNGYIYISYEDVTIDEVMKTYLKSVEDVDFDKVYKNDLTEAKKNGETLTELSLMIDSLITGSAYINLTVDGRLVIENAVLDDCIDNFVLDTPIKLNENSQVDLQIGVTDEFKKYITPYFYTITDKSQFEVGKLNLDILNSTDNQIYFYTKHNTIDNGNSVGVQVFKDDINKTADFTINGTRIKNNQTGISIVPKNSADNGNYVIKLSYNGDEVRRQFTYNNPNANSNGNNGNSGIGSNTSDIEKVKGDISLDGKLTVTDLSQLKGYIVNMLVLEGDRKAACDVNGDGNVTTVDISVLKKLLVGI